MLDLLKNKGGNMKTFETYQPATITPNNITEPSVFNGMCLIRKYKITIEEIKEPKKVLEKRLRKLFLDKGNQPLNRTAMINEAIKLEIDLNKKEGT